MGLETALLVGGAAMSAGGSISSGLAQAGSYKDQARQAVMEGRESKRLSNYKVRLIQQAGAETLSEVEAEAGKSGLAMSGTPLTHLVKTARQVELTAALERRAGTVEKQRYERQAVALRKAAKEAKRSGILGGLGGLVGGIGNAL